MMTPAMTQLGIGGIFALLILREVFGFLRAKKNPNSDLLKKIGADMAWLKDVHDQKDSDGVYSWYVRKSLQDQVQRLADSITSLNTSMHSMGETQERQTTILEKMLGKLHDTKVI